MAGYTNPEYIFCSLSKPPLWYYPSKRAVLKIKILKKHVVTIDENMFIQAINVLNNGWNSMISFTEKEHNDDDKYSDEEKKNSLQRVFYPECNSTERENRWCGKIELHALIPYLTRNMIRKVWIYSKNKRLRKKLQ